MRGTKLCPHDKPDPPSCPVTLPSVTWCAVQMGGAIGVFIAVMSYSTLCSKETAGLVLMSQRNCFIIELSWGKYSMPSIIQ